MTNNLNPQADVDHPLVYEIEVQGHLGDQWADWFGGVTITLEGNGNTVITGPSIDQAALYRLLKKVRDLGMPLVSVKRIQPGQASAMELSR